MTRCAQFIKWFRRNSAGFEIDIGAWWTILILGGLWTGGTWLEIFTIKRYIIKNQLHFSKISSRILMKMCGNLRKDLLPEYGHPLPTKPKGVYPLQFTNCRSICSQALPRNFGSSRRISHGPSNKTHCTPKAVSIISSFWLIVSFYLYPNFSVSNTDGLVMQANTQYTLFYKNNFIRRTCKPSWAKIYWFL